MAEALTKLALSSNKVANLVNGVKNMKREYRIISADTAEKEKGLKKNHLLMTIIVDKNGQYIRHYWG